VLVHNQLDHAIRCPHCGNEIPVVDPLTTESTPPGETSRSFPTRLSLLLGILLLAALGLVLYLTLRS
jgi:hypothetical protein